MGHGSGLLEKASLIWGSGGPACGLRVLPAPLAHSAHPHHTYPGGQALLAVQADSTFISDLREVFILKFLKADVMGEPGGSGDGLVTHCPVEDRRVQGAVVPVGWEQH